MDQAPLRQFNKTEGPRKSPVKKKSGHLSEIYESEEDAREPRSRRETFIPSRKSNLNLSQMGGHRKSVSNSKTFSGSSNVGSLTIKVSSKDEEFPPGSSRNCQRPGSYESSEVMRQKLREETRYMREEDEKSQHSQVNCSDYDSNEPLDDLILEQNLPQEELFRSKLTPIVSEGEGDADPRRKKQPVDARVGSQEPPPREPVKIEGSPEVKKSRRGRTLKKAKDDSQFLEYRPQSKSKRFQGNKKLKPFRCNCDKTGCINKYCVCYKNGQLCCSRCKCRNCINNESNKALTREFSRKVNASEPFVFNEHIQEIDLQVEKRGGGFRVESGSLASGSRK